jgi:hypothetical protein
MLNKIKENLLRSILWLEEASVAKYKAAQKKQQLLEMARNGESRPHQTKHPLGFALSNYTNPKSKCYDLNFDKEIRELVPEWFNVVNQKKQQLLEMAKNGEPRPSKTKHPLGSALSTYTNPKSDCYDPVFYKEIRELATQWFISPSDIANQNKQQLLEMARNGEPRPIYKKHPLGTVLKNYTKSTSYDPIFNKEIRELAPQWFVSRSDIANQKKQQLLEMAKNGEPRPNHTKHPLGQVLCSYTNPKHNSYDFIFDKEIRELAPKWFKNAKQTKGKSTSFYCEVFDEYILK